MKIKNGQLEDGVFDERLPGTLNVSRETALRHTNPTTVLLMRDPADGGRHIGVLLVFSLNPQALKFQQKALVSVQQGVSGYLVNQNGLSAPTWTITGHFGWRLRTVNVPGFVAQSVGKTYGPGNVVHRRPRLPNSLDALARESGAGALERTFGEFTAGRGDTLSYGGQQTLDGQQAWFALRDLLTFYFEENVRRVDRGLPPYELVWYDSLHSLQWVVVPAGLPTLDRSVNTQATMPYTLEFIGVYDDARRGGKEWSLLSAFDQEANRDEDDDDDDDDDDTSGGAGGGGRGVSYVR